MSSDNRPVVLLKSIHTLNRFYALAPVGLGWKNAEEIEDYPPDVLLGIAYPCLEDGLNDFAVIRSTFETIDSFPDDEDLRNEMMVIVVEARETLMRRLQELRDRLHIRQAHFLGTDLNEFKDYAVTIATKGNIRRTLDNMMKLDVYESVAAKEVEDTGEIPNTMYHYEFLPENALDRIRNLPPLEFVVRLFDDVLASADDENSYLSKYHFDKFVFQKFIALMFINYATTDPIFYGTNKADYGVSAGKDMTETPLYIAVGEALREIERQLKEDPNRPEEDIIRSTMHTQPTFGHGDEGERSDLPSPWDDMDFNTSKAKGEEDGSIAEPAPSLEVLPLDASVPALSPPEPPASAPRPPLAAPSMTPAAQTTPPPPHLNPVSAVGRTVQVPSVATAEQRLMVPLNSITMATELLKNSADPMAATYGQMIRSGVDALQAALREWGIIEK